MRWWWRKPADGFEWKDYVRTTILVRRNERRQKVEDAKHAAIFGVKQAGQKGVEAGAAGLDAAGRASKAAASAVGRGGKVAGSAVGRGGAAFAAGLGRGSLAAASAVGRGGSAAAGAMGRGGSAAAGAMGRRGSAAAGAMARGAASAARVSRDKFAAGGAAVGRASAAGWSRLGDIAGPHVGRVRERATDRLEPAIQVLLRPSIAVPLTVVALFAGFGAIYRGATIGFDGDVVFASVIALIAGLLALLPRLAVGDVPKPFAVASGLVRRGAGGIAALPGVDRVSPGMLASGVAAVLVATGAVWWMASAPSTPGTHQRTSSTADRASGEESDVPSVAVTRLPDLKGRGSAVAGDLVKVQGTTVRLTGIEAPEKDQRCGATTPGDRDKSWRCGQAARDAMARLVRSPLVCRLAGTDDAGFRLATCTAGEKDLAAELVRGGYVFAATGFFARYGSEESEARAARAGVWQSDEVQRPSEYRAQRWEEAKQSAPQGCPIKGAKGSRTYVLPWSSGYERVRVRENRGDRWFCTEQEAKAAGWRPTT